MRRAVLPLLMAIIKKLSEYCVPSSFKMGLNSRIISGGIFTTILHRAHAASCIVFFVGKLDAYTFGITIQFSNSPDSAFGVFFLSTT